MKKYIIILALCFNSPCLAQQPRIDSIAVDEDKGELVLHGEFKNSSSAIVLVDSVSLPVTLASDTLLRATIPDSGKGSAGWVLMILNGNHSNEKLLTYYHFQVYFSTVHGYSDGGLASRRSSGIFHVRFDMSRKINVQVPISKLSQCHDVAYGQDGIHGYTYGGPIYDSSGVWKVKLPFRASNNSFFFAYDDIERPKGDQSITCNVRLDNNYQVVSEDHDNYCNFGSFGTCFHWSAVAPTDFPPTLTSVSQTPLIQKVLLVQFSSNPIKSSSEIIVTLQNPNSLQMQILDILGHIISSDEKILQTGENKLPINASALSPGMYICRLQAGGEVVSMRFVKE